MPGKGTIKPPSKSKLNASALATTEFLDRTINTQKKWLEDAIGNLQKRIEKKLYALQTREDDRLYAAKVNLKQAQQIHKQLNRIFEDTYGHAARQVVDRYDVIAKYIEESYEDFGFAVHWTGVDKTMIDTLKSRTYDGFLRFGIDAQAAMSQAMYEHIAGGATSQSLIDTCTNLLTGKVSAAGRPMSTYATQFAFDASMNFHNAVNLKKAQDLGLTYFRYAGAVMDNTREFCARRAWRTFTRKEIESWPPTWKGASGPAMTHRGGYNCGHSWQAIDTEWLDEAELEEVNTLEPATEEGAEPAAEERMAAESKAKEEPKYTNPEAVPSAERYSVDGNYRERMDDEGPHGDERLYAVAKDQGFDGLPHVVSSKDLDAYVASGEVELWRGINEYDDKQRLGNAFVSGDYYAGEGIFANGTYTTRARQEALEYAIEGDDPHGSLLRMTLKRNARVVRYTDLIEHSQGFANEITDKIKALSNVTATSAVTKEISRLQSLLEFYDDDGVFAAACGYDAIEFPDQGYYVILNRTSVRASSSIEWVTAYD